MFLGIIQLPNILSTCCHIQKGIDENWEAAIEHNPEAFGRVVG
jgi:hypothetical protein